MKCIQCTNTTEDYALDSSSALQISSLSLMEVTYTTSNWFVLSSRTYLRIICNKHNSLTSIITK